MLSTKVDSVIPTKPKIPLKCVLMVVSLAVPDKSLSYPSSVWTNTKWEHNKDRISALRITHTQTYMCVCVLYKASYSLSVTQDYCSNLAEHSKEAEQPNLWACYGYNSMCRLKKTMRVDRSVNFSFRIRQQIKEMLYIIAKIWIAYSSCRTKNKISVYTFLFSRQRGEINSRAFCMMLNSWFIHVNVPCMKH